MKIAENRELEDFVEAGLYDDLSPEAIAGQIKSRKKNLTPISKDSIRRWIKSVYGRKVEYYRKKKKTPCPAAVCLEAWAAWECDVLVILNLLKDYINKTPVSAGVFG